MPSPALSKPQTSRVGSFVRSLRRVDEFARFDLILLALLLIFIASQIFWLGCLVDVGERFIPGRPRGFWLVIMTVVVYLFVCVYSYPEFGLVHVIRAADYRP